MESRKKISNTSASKLRSKKKICKDVSVLITLIYYLQTKMDQKKQFPASPSSLPLKTKLLKNNTNSKYPTSKELELTINHLPLKERKHLYQS